MSFAAHPFRQRHAPNRRGELEPTIVVGKCCPDPSLETIHVAASSRPAGLPTQTGHHSCDPGSVAARPLSTQWLTDERIAEARRVWSKAYGRVISAGEAIEILMNVRRLAEVLLRDDEEKNT